jgi:hypothetical protein
VCILDTAAGSENGCNCGSLPLGVPVAGRKPSQSNAQNRDKNDQAAQTELKKTSPHWFGLMSGKCT